MFSHHICLTLLIESILMISKKLPTKQIKEWGPLGQMAGHPYPSILACSSCLDSRDAPSWPLEVILQTNPYTHTKQTLAQALVTKVLKTRPRNFQLVGLRSPTSSVSEELWGSCKHSYCYSSYGSWEGFPDALDQMRSPCLMLSKTLCLSFIALSTVQLNKGVISCLLSVFPDRLWVPWKQKLCLACLKLCPQRQAEHLALIGIQ